MVWPASPCRNEGAFIMIVLCLDSCSAKVVDSELVPRESTRARWMQGATAASCCKEDMDESAFAS